MGSGHCAHSLFFMEMELEIPEIHEETSSDMIPDPSFVRALKEIAVNLEVVWSSGLDRWVIWYTAPNKVRHRIHEVKESDGSYRALDQRTLDMLRRCDMSTKVEDPGYIFSEQYRKREEYKQREIEKYREDAVRRSREMSLKWKQAAENAEKGIIFDKQLYQPKIFSHANAKLIAKLGMPRI